MSIKILFNRSRNIFTFLSVCISCVLFAPNSKAQNKKIDSLIIALNKHPQQDDERATTLFNLAAQTIHPDTKAAIRYVEEIISFQDKIKKKQIVSAAYRVKGMALFYLSKYPEALEFLHKAVSIDELIKHDYGIAGGYANIGIVYMAQSKYPDALRYYLSALKKFDLEKNELEVAITYMNMATVYNEMNNLTLAMEQYQKSYLILKKHNNHIGQANALSNIATIHFKNKNVAEAIKYGKLSAKLADSVGDIRSVARENGNLSAYYANIKQPDLALEYGLKAIELNKKISSIKSLGFNYQNVSSAYLKKGDFTKAKTYGLNALKIGNDLNVTELKRDASLGLSEVYEVLKKPDSALFYHKEFFKFSDSIGNDKKKTEITRMGLQYDFDRKELSYQQKQLLADEQLKQQALQLALNKAEIQKGVQFRDLQRISLENEQLINKEKEKQLIISQNNEKLQSNKVKALSQEQELNRLELKQLWLYGILAILVLGSVIVYLINLYRIRQLRFKNALQKQEALQNELLLKHQFQLTESELKAIRSQMNPHFIFNVLNSIEAYIMDNDKHTASRLIQKFASLSRLILENSTRSLVTADREWKALKLYTELEAMRYNNTFSFNFEADESLQLRTLLLPPMLIQPLIENAILHGLIVNPKPDAHIEVQLKKHEGGIRIIVEDNGNGISNVTKDDSKVGVKEKSIGLSSIKERIAIINAQRREFFASFEISSKAEGSGTVAEIFLPHFENTVA
ncbi:MAG: tetratricopeptide repeat protein [Pedobacter sp.]|uniref:tetratricopeptide repeat-containing sensor histidine kinase n=1 Tax=Pedobacter sp. TaxID=1411316 RepID=UPI0028077FA3|nr:tetratricopeptide repeat protein [Pedobacter sp.]MDQ8003490.1 tetratricopeptide repeat protein [Pedobacter sp.]